jgi:hypothetical protein
MGSKSGAVQYITPKTVFVQAAKVKDGRRKIERLILKLGINIWVTSSGKSSESQHWHLLPVNPCPWTIYNLSATRFVFPIVVFAISVPKVRRLFSRPLQLCA